jgi:hypothetical protein
LVVLIPESFHNSIIKRLWIGWYFNLSEDEQLNIFKGNNKGYYLISE